MSLVIEQLELRQFRNHKLFDVRFSPRITVITGRNGSGKTSIIEAIYILLRGSSFRGSDKEIVQGATDGYKVSAQFNNHQRSLKYQADSGKQFDVDANLSKRMLTKNKYPVVLFEPSDLQLIDGSPSRRRRYIDNFVANYFPGYTSILRKYERALKQRNMLLKNGIANPKDLFTWDVLISEYGAQIITQRTKAIATINKLINKTYHDITGVDDTVNLDYIGVEQSDNYAKYLHDQLQQSFNYDLATATTSVGPHRHDITAKFNGSDASQKASRGEVRSIILALKVIELDNLQSKTDLAPLLLLDDVFSELDSDRQKQLIQLTINSQVIMTSTAMPDGAVLAGDGLEVTI